ncbi:MAG TPA: biotin/lipoyl-containing protein [Candidatus Baltobacteraceae bacterium]
MSDAAPHNGSLVGRVRDLVETFVQTDLVRLRIERGGEVFELARPALPRTAPPAAVELSEPIVVANLETIRADLVGIFRFVRPIPSEGERIEGERELGYVEALGIRNPVRSRGAGRVVSILCADGDGVDYGRPLFQMARD